MEGFTSEGAWREERYGGEWVSWEQAEPGAWLPQAFPLCKPIISLSPTASWSWFSIFESRGLTNGREAANPAAQERKALKVTSPLNAKPFGNSLFCTNAEHYDYPWCAGCTLTLSRIESAPDIKKRKVCGWMCLMASESPFHMHN